MAIAPSPTRTADAKGVADALALIRKVKPRASKRANADATHVIVDTLGGIVGGVYNDTELVIPRVFGYGDECAIPFATLTDAVKGYRGALTLNADCIAREDGAYFSFPSGADALNAWHGKRVTESIADTLNAPDHSAMMAPDDFANMVSIITPHASADESRPVLTAVNLSADGEGNVSWSATDSFRAVIAECGYTPLRQLGPWSVNVSAAALRAIASVKPRGGVTIDVWDGDAGVVRITHGALTPALYQRQTFGQFPAIHKFIVDMPHELTIGGNALRDALATWKRNDMAPAVLNIPAAGIDGVLVLDQLAGLRDDAIRGTWRFPCDVIGAAEPVRIGINAAFLRDCVTSCPGGHVTIAYDTGLRPVIVAPADPSEPYSVRTVCMPVRV